MGRLILIGLLTLTGCVSLRNCPVNDLALLGNPLLRCVDKQGVVSSGRFVCKKTTESGVIAPCRATNDVGAIVLEEAGVYQTIINAECTFDER